MAAFLPCLSRARQQPVCCACVLATQPTALPYAHSPARSIQANANMPSRRRAEMEAEAYTQEFRVPPPPPTVPPPPPPPIFDNESAAMQNEEGNGMMLAGIGVACLTALGFVYGFQEDNTDALRATRNLPPRAEASIAATEGMRQQQFAMETFPTTVVTGEAPVGMQPQWAHQWRYDANGQPYVKVQERWWRLQRPPGSRALVTFIDVQNRYRPGLQYVYTAPSDWPLDEIDLCDQRTMALLFGLDTGLEDHLQPLE